VEKSERLIDSPPRGVEYRRKSQSGQNKEFVKKQVR
jgi:hypothetical protein